MKLFVFFFIIFGGAYVWRYSITPAKKREKRKIMHRLAEFVIIAAIALILSAVLFYATAHNSIKVF